MASSLEELLVEEGFKGSRTKSKRRSSLGKKAVSMPLSLCRDQNYVSPSPNVKIRPQRTRSDVSRLRSVKGRRNATRVIEAESSEVESKNDAQEIESGRERDSYDALGDENFVGSFQNLKLVSRYKVRNNTEFQEKSTSDDRNSYDVQKNKGLGNSLSNDQLLETETLKDKYVQNLPDYGIYDEINKDLLEDGRYKVSSAKPLSEQMSFSKDPRTEKVQSYKSTGDVQRNRNLERPAPEPAPGEVAIQAMIAIPIGYIRRFLKDGKFRTSLHRRCMSCLSSSKSAELDHDDENGVVVNFIEAINTVERVVEEIGDSKELKRATLQLSIIAGLNSKDLKGGFTSGIPNSDLAACAHIYLSVIYTLQKKRKVSAKHLLQVFCDSPFQARKNLLPELWNQLFLPHLSDLRMWYDQEAEAIPNTSIRPRKMKLLGKAYNEILDSGTCQFAVYYKEWLVEGNAAPIVPSILVPTGYVCGASHRPSPEPEPSPTGSVSSQPMISKRLYEAVFGHSNKLDGPSEANDEERGENFTTCTRGLRGTVEHGSTETNFPEYGTYTKQLIQEDLTYSEGDSPLPSWKPFVFKFVSAGQFANYRYSEGSLFVSSIPKDFICPFTGQLFEDPVTLETGQTFERVAIEEWLDQGNKTCPVTGKILQCLAVPITNIILKHVIDGWKSEHCKNLLDFATQVAGSSYNHEYGSMDEAAISILEQLLTGFNSEERMENAKHLLSLGGLQFLVTRFELGNLEEKARVAVLLSCCIAADGGCRNYIARNINKPCLMELLHSKKTISRTNAVFLLTELICLNRRKQITSLLSSFQQEGIMATLHVLLVYLQSSPHEQRPLVAVLLLHFDTMAEPRKYSLYREEAVDAIVMALECSETNEKVREQSCRSLLILGGHFSYSGETMTTAWLLKKAGFCDGSEANSFDNDDENVPWEEEEKAREDWGRNLTVVLLVNGKKSFLECICRCCLGSGDSNSVRACLTIVAWLSYTLASMSDSELQLSAFSIVIPMLKHYLERGQIEQRVLASLCLFNFSKISECRALLVTFAGTITALLHSLKEVTWTAEQLLSIIT